MFNQSLFCVRNRNKAIMSGKVNKVKWLQLTAQFKYVSLFIPTFYKSPSFAVSFYAHFAFALYTAPPYTKIYLVFPFFSHRFIHCYLAQVCAISVHLATASLTFMPDVWRCNRCCPLFPSHVYCYWRIWATVYKSLDYTCNSFYIICVRICCIHV